MRVGGVSVKTYSIGTRWKDWNHAARGCCVKVFVTHEQLRHRLARFCVCCFPIYDGRCVYEDAERKFSGSSGSIKILVAVHGGRDSGRHTIVGSDNDIELNRT